MDYRQVLPHRFAWKFFHGSVIGSSKFLNHNSGSKTSIISYTYIWVPRSDKTMMGSRKPDGTYTGILKLLAEDVRLFAIELPKFLIILHQKVDMSLYPLPIVPENEVFDLGPSIVSFPVLISSVMDLRVNDDNVLKQLFRFSAEIVVLLVVSVYVLSFVLTKSEKSRSTSIKEQKRLQETDTKFLGSLWYMVQLISLQPNYEPKTLPGKFLIVVTSIGVLFWYAIWGNLMTSDTVSYDASRLINNIDDIIRLNASMFMIGSDPAARMLELEAKYNPNSVIATLMNEYTTVQQQSDKMAKTPGGPMMAMRSEIDKLNDTMFLNKGVITLSPMVYQFESFVCQYRSLNTTKWDHKIQVVGDPRLPYSPFSPWYGKKLDPLIAIRTTQSIRKVSESGLLMQIFKEANQIAEQVLEIHEKGACIVHNADRYIQDLMISSDDVGIFVSIERISDVFQLYCSCMLLCAIVFMIEKSGLYTSVADKYQISMEELQRLRQERRMKKRRAKISKIVQKAKNLIAKNKNSSISHYFDTEH